MEIRDNRIPIWAWLVISVLVLLLRLAEGWSQEHRVIFDGFTFAFLSSAVIATFALRVSERRRTRYQKNGSHSNAHALMRELAILLGRPVSDLQTREDQQTLQITLPGNRTGVPLVELSRLRTNAVGPNAWQAGYSMDRVGVAQSVASKVKNVLAAAGYSYQSSGYKGLEIYTREADTAPDEQPPARGAATWVGQPIRNTADIANALFGAAMMSVPTAEPTLTEVAKVCRKDLNLIQMESLFLTLFSSRLALSRETYGDESLEASVLKEFDALVTTYCEKKQGFRGAFAQRSDRYLLALVPGSEIASTIGQEYSRICGCQDKMVASVGRALAGAIMKSAEELVSTYRQSQV